MSIKNGLGKLAWTIGTWVTVYGILYFSKVKNAKQITIILMIINLLIFPFAIEYIGPGHYIPLTMSLNEILAKIAIFYFLGPLAIAVNVKFLYLLLIGG